MKHKTWFRLIIKAIGVLLVGLAIDDIVTDLAGIIYAVAFEPKLLPRVLQIRGDWILILARYSQLFFGLYLFFGGKWIVNKAIPSNRPYCPECDYDLSQCDSSRCPECGTPVPDEMKKQSQEGAEK